MGGLFKIPGSSYSALLLIELTFLLGCHSHEAPKRSKIFDYFVLTEPEYSHFSIDYHSV